MNCEWVKENLSSYIDEELNEHLKDEISSHLKTCMSCNNDHLRLSNAWKLLDLWEDITPPDRLGISIKNKIRTERFRKWSGILIPAAAVFLIAISIVFIYSKEDYKTDKIIIVKTENKNVPVSKESPEISQDEIIANLHLLQEKDFLDSLDTLRKIDYLPLVDETGSVQDKDKSSSLELVCT